MTSDEQTRPWWQPAVSALGLAIGALPTPALTHLIWSVLRRRARKLPADEALRMLLELDRRMYHLTGRQSVRLGNGVHSKHRHLNYHRFFIDRVSPGQSVLDAGCGHGAVAYDLAAEAGASVTGVDYAPTSIEQARQQFAHERVTYQLGDLTSETPDHPFDVVVMSNVLEHLHDRPALLRHLVERHRPQSVLIRVPCYERDWRVPLKDELGIDSRLDTDHKIEFTVESFTAETRDAGLRITHLESRWGEIWAALEPAE